MSRVPKEPSPIRDRSKRYELVPEIEMYRVETVDPLSTLQEQQVERYGPIIRLWYVPTTFQLVCARREQLIKEGHPSNRIEMRYDWKEVVRIIQQSRFRIIDLGEPVKSK